MYAVINATTQSIQFYYTFSAASNACAAYDVQPGHRVYVIDFTIPAVEQL
jgi:hypothetical protein